MTGLDEAQAVRTSFASELSTAPEPKVSLPPSPAASDDKLSPGVLHALEVLRARREHTLDSDWNSIRLAPGDWDDLGWIVKRDEPLFNFVTNKVQ